MVAPGPPYTYITLFSNKIDKTRKCLVTVVSMFLISLNGRTRLLVKKKESENEKHRDEASQGPFDGSISKSIMYNVA